MNVDTGLVPVYPVIEHWGPGIMRTAPAWAERLGCDWIHVQYQTSAYGLQPAINFAPWFWRQTWWRKIWGRQGCVAWTYHDLRGPYLFPKAGAELRKWVIDRPAMDSDVAIVTNEADRLDLLGRAQRLEKVPIGSNIEPVYVGAEAREQQRLMHGYTEKDFVVGYFGFLNRSKGGLTLVRAFERLTRRHENAYLLMIGERVGASDPANMAYLHEVEELARQLGIADRMRWTGHLPDEEVSGALTACDVLLMPYEDGASLRRGTLMAGLAHGCAIVTTTPVSPLPELIDGRDVLFAPVGDAEAAAAAVMRIANEPGLAEQLRTNASARSALFAWERIAEQHQKIYASIDG